MRFDRGKVSINLMNVDSSGVLLLSTNVDGDVFTNEFLWTEAGLVVRHVRGGKMRDERQLYNEFAAAFQFPLYFGENSHAFDECMTDLDWLPRGNGYVVSITNAGEVMADDLEDAIPWLVRRFAFIQSSWASPQHISPGVFNPPSPFHVVLHCGSSIDQVEEKWASAGAKLQRF